MENMKYLSYGLKKLVNLKEFRLNLRDNLLGKNREIKYLDECFRHMSFLRYLTLDMSLNSLGKSENNFEILQTIFKEVPFLHTLNLDL